MKLEGENSQTRRKRQIPIPAQQIFDSNVPRTGDGVPILESSYLDRVGVVPSAPLNYNNFIQPQSPTPDNSEGLRLYESLVATGK
jgi:hypothetical protein